MEKTKYRKRFWLVHAALVLGVLGFAGLAVLWQTYLPQMGCLFLRGTHLYCPGCGGTRAVLALLCGRLLHAFLCYPPMVAFLFVWLYYEVKALQSYRTGDVRFIRGAGQWPLLLLAAAVLGWFVLHNGLLLFGYDYLGNVLPK